MSIKSLAVTVALVSLITPADLWADHDPLVVHEWGTFTSLQDDSGTQLARINVDDEPVPSFVHGYAKGVLQPQYATAGPILSQGAPARHPDVTLRLETPVTYFYPPKRQDGSIKLNVDVRFHGGWLTQFYPYAIAEGFKSNLAELGPLTPDTVSALHWNDLLVGTNGELPQTDEAVWTAPRKVNSATVTVPQGGSEKYLFYRGVGHLDSPLAAVSDLARDRLTLYPRFQSVLKTGQSEVIEHLWLVHIRSDGTVAYRRLESIRATADPAAGCGVARRSFDAGDFDRANLDQLNREMHDALTVQGLYADEATAMLATWQKSYFASGGLRLFYVVPRIWTEHFLPLTISEPAEITRVLLARTELISPEQRELLARLSISEPTGTAWLDQVRGSPGAQAFFEGRSEFGDLGVEIPSDYETYLALGRFRNALVLMEHERTANAALARFIAAYGLNNPAGAP